MFTSVYVYNLAAHTHARTHTRTHARTHTHTHTHTHTCPRHKKECPYANMNMRTHTPNTNNTSYPYLAYVTHPAHRPLFRHAIQDTPVATVVTCCRHMRRDFCLVWRGLDYLHGGLQQDMLYTTKPLQK